VLLERHALTYLKLDVGDRVVVAGFDGRPVPLRITGSVHDPSLAPAYEEGKGYGFVTTATLPLLGAEPVLDELAVTVADAAGGTTPSRDRDAIVRTALSLAERLQRTTGAAIQQVAVPAPYEHPHQGQMNAMLASILAFGALALLLSAILITTMINGLLTQQIPQIGILKAVGARSGRVLQLYLLMTLLVVGAATALAFVPGVVLGREWARLLLIGMLNMEVGGLEAPWWTYVAVVVTGLGLPLLVAVGPVLGASRTTVREAIAAAGVPGTAVSASGFDAWLSGIRGLDRTLLLGLRNSFRRRGRFLLSVGLLATAGTIFVAGLNTFAAIRAIPETLAADRRWDVEVGLAAPAANALLEETAARVPGVTHVEAWSSALTGVRHSGEINVTRTYPDKGHGAAGVTAVPPATSLIAPLPLRAGRWLRPDDGDAIVLNQMTLQNLPGIRVGESRIQLPIEGRLTDWLVVGVVDELFAPLCPCVSSAGFDRATGRRDQATSLRIVTDRHDPSSRLEVTRAVARALTDRSIKVQYVRPMDWLIEVSEGHIYVLVAVFLLIATVMGVVGLIGLGSTLSANVLERTREFAVLRAVGARAATVRRVVVTEGVFMALVSCAVAVAPALALTAAMGAGIGNLFLFTPLPFRLSLPALASWVVAILIGAALASLAPAARAARLTVREALAYV
jgi:putative ABC transport system permease protein